MSLAARLGSICSEVSEAEDQRELAGRDWWPVAMVWEREGRDPVPSRPDVVARPTSVEEVSAVGSGDAFVGAFAAKWLETHDVVEAARWGGAAGAANAAQVRSAFCAREEIEKLLLQVRVERM